MSLKCRRSAADAVPELEQGCLMYLEMTLYKDWIPEVCDRCSSEVLGGSGLGSGVGQVETKCQGDERCGLLEMWVCGGGEE